MSCADPRCETVRIARLLGMRQCHQSGVAKSAFPCQCVSRFSAERCRFRIHSSIHFIKSTGTSTPAVCVDSECRPDQARGRGSEPRCSIVNVKPNNRTPGAYEQAQVTARIHCGFSQFAHAPLWRPRCKRKRTRSRLSSIPSAFPASAADWRFKGGLLYDTHSSNRHRNTGRCSGQSA